MGIIEKYIITVNFTKTNIFQAKKKKKSPVPKNQSFNTRSYLTSKNSKRSMNTALPYNNNLNDENSKSKQKQTKKALINLQTIPSKQRKKKKHLEYLPKLI